MRSTYNKYTFIFWSRLTKSTEREVGVPRLAWGNDLIHLNRDFDNLVVIILIFSFITNINSNIVNLFLYEYFMR
jgi:hypothetical protein